MPWKRYKLMPESKLAKIQKRWFRWPNPFAKWYYHRDYMRLDTPINMMKEKCVELQGKVEDLLHAIDKAERRRDAIVKYLAKSTLRDGDGGGLTQWKREPQPHLWSLSLFQWSIPFIMEPPEFDPKLYRGGYRGGSHKKRERPKDWQGDINALKKSKDAFNEEMIAQREMERDKDYDDEDKGDLPSVFSWQPAKSDKDLKQGHGEKKDAFNRRKKENAGKIIGIDNEVILK
jgi:hypothetical protein